MPMWRALNIRNKWDLYPPVLENFLFQRIKATMRTIKNTPITDPTITGTFDLELEGGTELGLDTVKSVPKESVKILFS